MKKISLAILAAALVALAVGAYAIAAAKPYKVAAALTAKAEVPAPKGATGKGTFTGTYVENKTGAVLKWKLTYSGLTGAAAAAHIHKAKPGVAGAVLVPLCGPCKNGMTGTANISKAVVAALESGGTYVNVHTAKNGAGEIRGQVKVTG